MDCFEGKCCLEKSRIRLWDLKQKEVINICSCKRLGCVADLEFDCRTGCIEALIIPGPGKFLGFLGRDMEYVVPWRCVEQIGKDIILVRVEEDKIFTKCE